MKDIMDPNQTTTETNSFIHNNQEGTETMTTQTSAATPVLKGTSSEWLDAMTIPLTAANCWVMAQIAIPNNSDRYGDEDDMASYIKNEDRRKKLADICLKHGVQLFPFPERIAVIQKLGMEQRLRADGQRNEKQLPKQLWLAWYLLGNEFSVDVFTGKEYKKDKSADILIRGTQWEVTVPRLENFNEGVFEEEEITVEAYKTPEEMEGVPILYAHEAGTWMLAWTSLQLSKLAPSVLGEVLNCLQPTLELVTSGDNTHVGFSDKGGTYYLNLNTGELASTRGGDRQVANKVSVMGFPVPGVVVTALTLLPLASKRFMGSVSGELNARPNLWFTDANYGHKWEEDHPTRVITMDSRTAMGAWHRTEAQASLSVWPFVITKNERHSSKLAALIEAAEGMASTDKYNKQSTGGVTATLARGLYFDMAKQIVASIHDAGKISKLHNRPNQARVFSCAYAECIDKMTNQVTGTRRASAMRVNIES